MKKLLSWLMLAISPTVLGAQSQALPEQTEEPIREPILVETESRFTNRLETVVEEIPFGTVYQDNSELELDTYNTLVKGESGQKIKTYQILLWDGEEVECLLDKVEIIEPTEKLVARGTKIVWRDQYTQDQGVISYWRKPRVWATSYDANCFGCTGRTFTGTEVKVGVCAVDPKTIRLGTTFYVPGYGLCRAEDIGGAIKGNDVDLGFADVSQGWWSARWVDIYIMDNPFIPEE